MQTMGCGCCQRHGQGSFLQPFQAPRSASSCHTSHTSYICLVGWPDWVLVQERCLGKTGQVQAAGGPLAPLQPGPGVSFLGTSFLFPVMVPLGLWMYALRLVDVLVQSFGTLIALGVPCS